MLAPIVTYLLKIDREKWAAFRERIDGEGRTVRYVLEALIDLYINRGLDQKPKPKNKK